MNTMDELIAFIGARLDEEERTVSGAGPALVGWATYLDANGRLALTSTVSGDPPNDDQIEWFSEGKQTHPHSVRVVFDPAHVQAEVNAKRRILNRCDKAIGGHLHGEAVALDVLGWLAQPYADHPDYSAEWRP